MGKHLFFLLFIISLLFFISCPQELTKGTAWEGEMEGTFDGFKDDDSDNLLKPSDSGINILITFFILLTNQREK